MLRRSPAGRRWSSERLRLPKKNGRDDTFVPPIRYGKCSIVAGGGEDW